MVRSPQQALDYLKQFKPVRPGIGNLPFFKAAFDSVLPTTFFGGLVF